MARKIKTEKLAWKKGWLIFAVSWIITLIAVTALRHILIPKDEMDCYYRVCILQKAVDKWNQVHPDKKIIDDIDEPALVKESFLMPQAYDHDKHYYFVGETAHGLRVKCNKHEDNPLILRLTGVTLLALLVFVVYCSNRNLVLFDG
jgi:hypothetical protein